MVDNNKEENSNLVNNNLGSIDCEFRSLLKDIDPQYASKIGYVISCCNGKHDYYTIEIFPSKCNNDFNYRQYFISNFEKGKGEEKLLDFTNKNNVGLITY
jgi:hypothetical protein